MDDKQILTIGVIAVVLLVGVFLLTPDTRNMAVQTSYQQPVYETRNVAVSVPYQEAIYETRYSGTFADTGISTTSWTFQDATSYTYEYSGKDLWGSPEYTFKVCIGSQCTSYPEINTWDVSPKSQISGYQTKYKTEYKMETYIARYEMKYRTENRDVTKTRLEWIFD